VVHDYGDLCQAIADLVFEVIALLAVDELRTLNRCLASSTPGGGGKVPINPGYVLYHDNEKIVIRNYEGQIFEYPETGGDQAVQFAPQREYHDEYLYS